MAVKIETICRLGLIDDLQELIDMGFNFRFEKGSNLLTTACIHGQNEVVKMLLEQGADFGDWEYHGFRYCIINGDKYAVDYLLNKEPSLLKVNTELYKQAKEIACENGHGDLVEYINKKWRKYKIDLL
jgi:ankyrin repeat protein